MPFLSSGYEGHIVFIMDLVHSFVSCFVQVDLGLIKTNPICRLGL